MGRFRAPSPSPAPAPGGAGDPGRTRTDDLRFRKPQITPPSRRVFARQLSRESKESRKMRSTPPRTPRQGGGGIVAPGARSTRMRSRMRSAVWGCSEARCPLPSRRGRAAHPPSAPRGVAVLFPSQRLRRTRPPQRRSVFVDRGPHPFDHRERFRTALGGRPCAPGPEHYSESTWLTVAANLCWMSVAMREYAPKLNPKSQVSREPTRNSANIESPQK